MFNRIRKHLTPSTAIAFVALVFAVTGGAFAATGGGSGASHPTLTASIAKSKAKTKAGPRGPAGPKGATGATGVTGATGATGVPGPAGALGPKGENGAAGTNGTNGENGKEGIQGKQGIQGIQGKPGESGILHPGETLPASATETGTWSFSIVQGNATAHTSLTPLAQISFPIPLAAALSVDGCEEIVVEEEEDKIPDPKQPCQVHYVYNGKEVMAYEKPTSFREVVVSKECAGTAEKPTAGPGNLCIYEAGTVNVPSEAPDVLPDVDIYRSSTPISEFGGPNLDGTLGAGTTGAVLRFPALAGGAAAEGQEFGYGTWAVTAPTS